MVSACAVNQPHPARLLPQGPFRELRPQLHSRTVVVRCMRRTAMAHGDPLQLSCSDSLGTDGHSSGAGDQRQAAIGSDTEATDGTVPSIAYIEEAAVIAQCHVDGCAAIAG